MYFAQSAMVGAANVVFSTDGIRGGVIEDGRPTVRPAPQRPVCTCYVDNGVVIGWDFKSTLESLNDFHQVLSDRKLLVGDREEPGKVREALGFLLDLNRLEIRHKSHRVWRTYKSIRCLERLGCATSHMIEVLIGHLVSFFMLDRSGLI